MTNNTSKIPIRSFTKLDSQGEKVREASEEKHSDLSDKEWILDKSGVLLVRFAEGKYISILPVTKYQFERYIWNNAPSWCEYEAFISETRRIAPSRIAKNNFSKVFLTNISFQDAHRFCQWVDGRLPDCKELEGIYHTLFHKRDFLTRCQQHIAEMLSRNPCILDKRWGKILDFIIKNEISREDINEYAGEIVSHYSIEPYGKVFVQFQHEMRFWSKRPCSETRHVNYGFSYIIAKPEE